MVKFILLFSFICLSIQFNFLKYKATDDIKSILNYEKVEVTNEKYLKDLEFYKEVQDSTIVTTCMLQVRNVLYKKNPQLKNILQQTKYPKDKVFDKIILTYFALCKQELLTKDDINSYLSPETILNVENDIVDKMQLGNIDFNSPPEFSPSDLQLLNKFYNGSIKKKESDENIKKVSFEATPIETNVLDYLFSINIFALKYIGYGLGFGLGVGFILSLFIGTSKKFEKEKKKK